MKRLVKSFLVVVLLIVSISFIPSNKIQAEDIDLIHNYEILVEPNDDGTLQMTYHINWEVLDDVKEGPLSWVSLGVWNRKIDDVYSLSPGIIQKVDVYTDEGAYIDVYFNQNYYAGDIVDFTITFKQNRVFTYDNGEIKYRFNPGWFDEINVENCTVYWKKEGVVFANNTIETDDYLIWSKPLSHSETMDVDVVYKKEYFSNIDLKKDYLSYQKQEKLETIAIICLMFAFFGSIVYLLLFIAYKTSDGYSYHRGFGGRYWYYYRRRPRYNPGYDRRGRHIPISTPTSSGSSGHGVSGSGHSCACACACACAGGGRAGCSRKDFTKKENLNNQ